MDYTEIMNFCGYDLDKSHEMAKQYKSVNFSESIKKLRLDISSEPEGVTDNGDDA